MWRTFRHLINRLRLNQSDASAATPAAAPWSGEAAAPATLPYNYPVITRGGKLGIHSVRPSNCLAHIQNLKNRGGRFPVVKAVNDMDWLIQVKEIDPDIITIGRINTPDEGLQGIEYETDMQRRVDYLFAPILQKLTLQPALRTAVDYWEICNEPDPPHNPPAQPGYTRLAECMIACMQRADNLGLKIAVFALNAGTPEWNEIEAMVATGVFGVARRSGHILTLHEAVFGFTDPIDVYWPTTIPGAPPVPNAGALTTRYRFLYHLLAQRNEVIPLVISEMVYGGGYGQDGQTGQGVANRATWYDDQLSRDYYVWAHLPFTLGGGAGLWELQDYEFAYPALIDLMASVRQRPNATPPPAPTIFRAFLPIANRNAVTRPSTPSLDHAVVLNLVPRNATLSELIHVLTAVHAARETVLQHPLVARNLAQMGQPGSLVKIWAPERWSPDPVVWMAQAGATSDTFMLPPYPYQSPVPLTESPRPTVVSLLPPGATVAEKAAVAAQVHAGRDVLSQSADDAVTLVQSGISGSKVRIWSPSRWSGDIVAYFVQRGIPYEIRSIP